MEVRKLYYVHSNGNTVPISICGADVEVGDNIGSGTGSYPNQTSQCIFASNIPNGNYYQVYQFESQPNYWQRITVTNQLVSSVLQAT